MAAAVGPRVAAVVAVGGGERTRIRTSQRTCSLRFVRLESWSLRDVVGRATDSIATRVAFLEIRNYMCVCGLFVCPPLCYRLVVFSSGVLL